MKNTMVAFVVGIGMAVLMMACDVPRETRRSTHYSDQLLVEDKLAVSRYEECVNSRFPLRANRYASVTADAVAQRILEGRLSFEAMERAYSSLGCGDLWELKPSLQK